MITDFNQLDLSKQYSYADYLTWQFEERVELIKGWIWKMSPAPLRQHQEISISIASQLYSYLNNKSCKVYTAPFDVRLVNKQNQAEDAAIFSVVQPDISVVCDLAKLDAKGCIGAPDLVIEILSPGNNKKEVQDKFRLYEENGVREYWIVYPVYKSVAVYDLVADFFVLRDNYSEGDAIPVGIFNDFSIDSKEMFA
jgi:Uma2 family endonuclease